MLYRLLTITFFTLLLLGTSSAKANNSFIIKAHESNLIAICEAIKTNNVRHMNKAVRTVKTNLREVSDKLICNGMKPFEFAVYHQANKTAERIAQRSKNKDELLAKLATIKSNHAGTSAD